MPEQVSIDNVVMKLCEKVKEIDKLNKIIDKQQNIIETQQKEFIEYKNYSHNKIKELEENFKFIIEYNNGVYFNSEEIIKLKEELPKFKEKLLYTQIMKNNELNLIEEGVKNKLNKNIKKFRLLFRASRDGFQASNFHSKCDDNSNTLTLVETTEGKRFGGFTDAKWDQSNSYKTGSNGFIFSLNDKAIYYNKNSSYNIRCDSSYGPTFGGGHDFYLCDNCNTSNSSYDSSNHSYDTKGKNYALAGNSSFYVKDYEVYQLELE